MLELFLVSLIATVVLMSVIFAWAHWRRRYDIIDVVWGVAFIVIAINTFIAGGHSLNIVSVQVLVLTMVVVWGFRLAIHILQRWRLSAHEDKRYTSLREQYAQKVGGLALNMFVRVYILQAVLAVVVSSPVLVVMANQTTDVNILAWGGVAVWAIGFYFEAVGDWQLRRFLSDSRNKGKLMTQGVWRYTRHPNYFGEITQWWGIFIIAAIVVPSLWWLAIVGPLVITGLLMFVSGVPLTEKHFEGRPGWDEYKRRTSKLLPLPPRR